MPFATYANHPTSPFNNRMPLHRWDPLIDGVKAAELLRLSPTTLTKWRATNRPDAPRAMKLDQIVRYRTSEITRIMDGLDPDQVDLVPVDRVEDQLLNLTEAATYLSLSGPTISTWRTRRPEYAPPGCKMGAALRFRLSELNAWADKYTEAT